MGSAVSAVTGAVSSLIGGTVGSVVSPILGSVGGAAGSALGGLAQGIISAIPDVPIADQNAVQQQINTNAANAANYGNSYNGLVGNAGTALNNYNNNFNQASANVQQAQGAVNNAQNVNTGTGSNVNNAIGLVGQTAAGGGAAQQAANATLQQGTNQALASQQAIANSGNLSQMVSGQKTALDNAANIQQQNALNAAQLQAGLATTAQGQYTGAAAQQAGQAAQNAGLQQQQTAAQQQQSAQQASLLGTELSGASSLAGAANTAQGNALTGQTNALGIEQTALGQTGQNQAMAVGGVLNAAGGAGSALLGSDEDSKTDVTFASGPQEGAPAPSLGGENGSTQAPYNSASSPLTSSQSQSLLQPNQPGVGANIIQTPGDTSSFNAVNKSQGLTDEQGNLNPNLTSDQAQQFAQNVQTLHSQAPANNNVVQQKTPLTAAQIEVIKNAGTSFSKLGTGGVPVWQGIQLSSDENGKKDINKSDKVSNFLDAIDPVSFKYKQTDGQMGRTPGEHLGVIAQQVEKAPGGKPMVIDTPQGKAIDLASAVGTLMAAAAETHDRVKELEQMFQSKRKGKK